MSLNQVILTLPSLKVLFWGDSWATPFWVWLFRGASHLPACCTFLRKKGRTVEVYYLTIHFLVGKGSHSRDGEALLNNMAGNTSELSLLSFFKVTSAVHTQLCILNLHLTTNEFIIEREHSYFFYCYPKVQFRRPLHYFPPTSNYRNQHQYLPSVR